MAGWPAHATLWWAGLSLCCKDPRHPWTISKLARRAGTSRQQLAERFRRLLGGSPMAYLTQWRLRLALEYLESSNDSVAEVAMAVGYSSEAAFNPAFKRRFACPPAQFRRREAAHDGRPQQMRQYA